MTAEVSTYNSGSVHKILHFDNFTERDLKISVIMPYEIVNC